MDLTPPKQSAPWWTLLRCCHPSGQDAPNQKVNDAKEDDVVSKGMTTSQSGCTECSEETIDSIPHPKIKEVTFTAPVETSTETATPSSPDSSGSNGEPHLITIEEDEDESTTAGSVDDKQILSATSNDFEIPFRTFLLYMVLRNILGVDYLTEYIHSHNETLKIKRDEESSSMDKTKVDMVAAME